MNTILIIDDEEKLRSLLARILAGEGFDVVEATDLKTGLKKLEKQAVDVVLCDVKLPDGSGVDFTSEIKNKYPETEVILLTAYGNIADGVKAIKNGAFDYLIKGDDNDKILPLLHRAIEKASLQKRVSQLEKRVGEKYSFENITGISKKFKEAITLAKKVAPLGTTVLLTGETGTGKEVFSQAIHQLSPFSNKNFVALNCSAIGKEIIESELFGYKQGAFTGALKDKKGLVEEAAGGTLFLDEIGEMPLDLQAKLLRILETGEFIKAGDTKTYKVNFRLIAATNRDLKKESEKGNFRSDLYFRLNVFEINLPPLRERVEDIEALASFFASQFSAKTNKKTLTLTNEYLEVLKHYHWPGNIRELKNIVERSVILSDGDSLTVETLPSELRTLTSNTSTAQLSAFDLASAEKIHIQKVLNYTGGNKTETARLLNIGLTTLYRKIEEYKLG